MILPRTFSLVFMGTLIGSCGSHQRTLPIEEPPLNSLSESEKVLPDQPVNTDSTLQIVLSDENDTVSQPLMINKIVIAEGNIYFSILNTSKKTIHDVTIAKMKNKDLPIVMKPDNKSIDASASKLVEQIKVNRIRPNKAAKVTTILRVGYYLIYCTLSGHYAAGESAILNVVEK